MTRARVLVVDDSVVVRRIVTDMLKAEPDIDVAGTAPNGRIALAKIPQVNPDVVTLDVEMPEMDGLETLAAIRKAYPKLPVIMFSTLTEKGAATTIEGLLRGANDYVTKPANVGSVAEAMTRVRDQLVPKIHALCPHLRPVATRPVLTSRPAMPARAHPRTARPQRIDCVAIGVSTGGPNALASLLPQLPSDLPVPIVIVQHMPPTFTLLLAQRLSAASRLPVHEGQAGAVLAPGHAWIAPGDYHMLATREGTPVRLRLNQQPPENSCRPAADVLFRSVVATYGANVLGIVLTGMGQDGLRGCEYIKEAGGQVIAQDEASSVVWGMPGAVARAGLADEILPLSRVAGEITRRAQVGRAPAGASPRSLTIESR